MLHFADMETVPQRGFSWKEKEPKKEKKKKKKTGLLKQPRSFFDGTQWVFSEFTIRGF